VLEAAAEAEPTIALAGVRVAAADDGRSLGGLQQKTDLVFGQPNNAVYRVARTDRLPVAVVEEAPIRVEVEEPAVPIVRRGSLELKVSVERLGGFEGKVRLLFPFRPPGIGAAASVEIPADQTEGVYLLNANPDAPLGEWQVAVTALAQPKENSRGDGEMLVASRLVTQSPDDFLVVKGLLQKGAGPAGGNYPWHVLVDTPPRYMIRPDDGQDLASTPDEISYELAEGEISWQDAPALMGEKVTVIGKIIRTNNIGEITFLNFHTNYQQTVTVVIEKENYSKFPQPPEKYYQGKTVRVRGTVSEYDAKPQIIVTDPKQIDVL